MPRYVALLRGVNVGGRNKVAMANLRQAAASLGHTGIATYLHSGNLVFTSPDASVASLADALEQQIARSLAVQPAVVVLSGAGLAQVIADNPFPGETNPKCLHAVFRRREMTPLQSPPSPPHSNPPGQKAARMRPSSSGRRCSCTHPAGSDAASWPYNSHAPAARPSAPRATGRR